MLIRCWGSRGSIPVSGKQYIKYGGNTPCIEIRGAGDEVIIVDTGSGVRPLGNKLISEKKSRFHILYTHFHWDHILGLPFFRPVFMKKSEIKIYGCTFSSTSLKKMIAITMTNPYFPVQYGEVSANFSYKKICEKEFNIGNIKIKPIPLSHPNGGFGYKFTEDGKTFVYLTDNELGYRHKGGLTKSGYRKHCRDADLLIHDAEFRSQEYKNTKTWGHSVFNDALDLALSSGVSKLGLFHHNQDRSDKDVDLIIKECENIINKGKSGLKCFGVAQDTEIRL